MSRTVRSILFIAASSGEGQFREIIDPKLAGLFKKSGFHAHSCYLGELKREHLAECSVLVIIRTPMPGHAKDDTELFRKWTPEILQAVRSGMGLVIFFSESYGRSEGTLNEFTKPLGAACYFNQIEETNAERRGMIPNLDGGTTVLADVLETPGISAMEVVTGGGHGTQQLTCRTDSNWTVLLRGSKTCTSRAFQLGFYSHGSPEPIETPVFAAFRNWGDGVMALFPGSAPLWLSSACLPRFEGHLLGQRNGAGLKFLLSLFERTGRRVPPETSALEQLDESHKAAETFSFRYVSAEAQSALKKRRPFRVFIGTVPDGMTQEALARNALECGCAAVVPVTDYDSLTPESWKCRRQKLTGIPGISAMPGYEQIDEEGNDSVVFSVDELPSQRKCYPNSNLLEDLLVKLSGYCAICARPELNRYPPWRWGGYNAMEYDGSAESLAMFRFRTGSACALSPVTVGRGVLPSEEKFHTYVLASTPEEWRRGMTENFHHTFVASGSVRMTDFGLYGPSLMLDDWEGFWYEWENGEKAVLRIALESDSVISEVTVYDGEQVFRRYAPRTKNTEIAEEIVFERDLRLTVSARCADGGELAASFPVYTRNRHFWAHAGSDQMNDYHNVFLEKSSGMMGIGGRFYEPCGFVTCGFAWGDYVRITPPVPWSDLMPSGIEVSSMTSSFKSFHPSPFVMTESGGCDFLNNHRRGLGLCSSEVHIVNTSAGSMWLEQPGAVWRGHGGRVFHPTRAVVESRLWRCAGTYEIPKWRPYEPTVVKFHLVLEFIRSFRLSEGRIIIAQSLHSMKKGLLLNGEPLERHLQPGTEVPSDWKEWDNLSACRLFRNGPGTEPVLRGETLVVDGDPCGTFRFHAPSEIGGTWFVRAWRWRGDGFMLSYEWAPESSVFRKGRKIPLEYSISLEVEKPS